MDTSQYLAQMAGMPPDQSQISRAYNGYFDTGSSGQLIEDQSQAQARLAEILKFDPNAKMQTIAGTTYSNDTGTGTRPDQYEINYDQSLDPANVNRKAVSNQTVLGMERSALESGKYDQQPQAFNPNDPMFSNTSKYGSHEWLSDPSKVWFDQGTDQYFTSGGNVKSYYSGTKGDATNAMIGQSILGLATGVMGGGIGAAAGGGLIGAGATGAFNIGMGELLSGGKMTPIQMLMSMAGSVGSQVPGGSVLMNLYKLFEMTKGQQHG